MRYWYSTADKQVIDHAIKEMEKYRWKTSTIPATKEGQSHLIVLNPDNNTFEYNVMVNRVDFKRPVVVPVDLTIIPCLIDFVRKIYDIGYLRETIKQPCPNYESKLIIHLHNGGPKTEKQKMMDFFKNDNHSF